jgi:hypothetical protein
MLHLLCTMSGDLAARNEVPANSLVLSDLGRNIKKLIFEPRLSCLG